MALKQRKEMGKVCVTMAETVITHIAEEPDIVIIIFAKKYAVDDELEIGFGVAATPKAKPADIKQAIDFAVRSVENKEKN